MDGNKNSNASGSQDEQQKKSPFDQLSKEDLINKCKGLLGLAQRAKQAKDEIAEENKRISTKLSEYETQKDADKKSLLTMKEMVDTLTENKLSLISQLTECEQKLKTLENSSVEAEIENESLKRQQNRLTDENEDLINDLQKMEDKLKKVNEFGKQQKIDLELLEEQTNKLLCIKSKYDAIERENLILTEELNKMQSEKKDNSKSNDEENYSKILEENKKLIFNENHQKEKIQYLKTKLIDILSKLKKLKLCKKVLLQTQIEYSESVAKWQKDITNASQQLMEHIQLLETKLKMYEKQKLYNNQKFNAANFESKFVQLFTCCDNAIKEFNEKSLRVQELTKSLENSNENFQKLQTSFDEQSNKLHVVENQNKNQNENIKKILEQESTEILNKYELKFSELSMFCEHAIKEFNDKSMYVDKLLNDLQLAQNKNVDLIEEIANLKEELETSKFNINNTQDIKFNEITEKYKEVCNDLKIIDNNLDKKIKEYEMLKTEYDELNNKNISLNDKFNTISNDLQNSTENCKLLQSNYDEQAIVLQGYELSKKSLQQELGDLKESLENEKLKLSAALDEKYQTIERMKFENSELLTEMRELNEALKGRGDVISRQQNKILELEAENKKFHNSDSIQSENPDNNVTKPQKTTSNVESSPIKIQIQEIQNPSNYNKIQDNQSEILSVSSISRADDSIRMREVDESFEEKYIKLRTIAIKLKKKVQEQAIKIDNHEKENSVANSSTSKMGTLQMKNLQALQNENDRLLDEIEKLKKISNDKDNEIKDFKEDINSLNNNLTKTNQNLNQMEKAKNDKETSIVQFQKEIKLLKQEKETFNLIRKELEKDRDNIKKMSEEKDKEKIKLKEDLEKMNKELEKLKVFGKQSNVLNLEIQAYEKSLNDASQKLDVLKVQNKELTETVESKEEVNASLKMEIKLLEENVESEKCHSQELKHQIDIQLQKQKQIEHDKIEMQTKLQDLITENESKKSEIEETLLQLSEIAAEKEKLCTSSKTEQTKLYRQKAELLESLENMTIKSKTYENELENVRTEFASYKLRAQSVLRQNQSKETSRECELEEELIQLQGSREALNLKLNKSMEQNELHVKQIDELQLDNEIAQKRCKELIELLDETRLQNDQILNENHKQVEQNQNSIKTLRLQIETLNKCYKEQLDGLETKHNQELEQIKKQHYNNENNDRKLQSRTSPFGGGISSNNVMNSLTAKTPDEHKIDLILMEREDAEGSEASYSIPKRKISSVRSKHDFISLDELLNSSLDESPREYIEERTISPTLELQLAKEKLNAQECRIRHLTSLLGETEQDLVKFTQLNEHLKEEYRRHERSLEREKHAHNSEYLKNVVIKFLTLNSGDERTRLVPVLNTILKLSPDETTALQNVAKGLDVSNRGWGSFMPIWSNHQ